MDEKEWLACIDPRPMLYSLKGKTTDRKLQLFAVGCCRRIWHLFSDERNGRLVDITERHADGIASEDDQATALFFTSSIQNIDGHASRAVFFAASSLYYSNENLFQPITDVTDAAANAAAAHNHAEFEAEFENERSSQGFLLRCIFGNPFRFVAFDRSWLTPPVKGLAQAIYTDRAFTDLPILADGLEEAGCTNADLLDHCRQPGEHVRGCWVVDLILGKE